MDKKSRYHEAKLGKGTSENVDEHSEVVPRVVFHQFCHLFGDFS